MNKELCVQTFVTDSQKIVVRPYEFISPYTEISNIGGQVIMLLAGFWTQFKHHGRGFEAQRCPDSYPWLLISSLSSIELSTRFILNTSGSHWKIAESDDNTNYQNPTNNKFLSQNNTLYIDGSISKLLKMFHQYTSNAHINKGGTK